MPAFASPPRMLHRLLSFRKTVPNIAAIAIEAVNRVTIWGIFMALGESYCADFMSQHAATGMLSYVVDFLFSVLFIIGLRRCGESDLVRDMKDLYFYDAVLQILGFTLQIREHDALAWDTLNAAILYFKTLRMLWLGLSADGTGFAGWPVFGPFGYLAYRRNRTDPRIHKGSCRHDRTVVVCLVLAFLLTQFIRIDLAEDVKWRLLALPFAAMLFAGRRFVSHIAQGHKLDSDLKATLHASHESGQTQQSAQLILLKQQNLTEHFTPEGLSMWRRISRLNPEAQRILRAALDGAEADEMAQAHVNSPESRRAKMQLVTDDPNKASERSRVKP